LDFARATGFRAGPRPHERRGGTRFAVSLAAPLLGGGDLAQLQLVFQWARIPDRVGILPDRVVAGEPRHIGRVENGAARPLLDVAVIRLDLVLAAQVVRKIREYEIMVPAAGERAHDRPEQIRRRRGEEPGRDQVERGLYFGMA